MRHSGKDNMEWHCKYCNAWVDHPSEEHHENQHEKPYKPYPIDEDEFWPEHHGPLESWPDG